MKKEKDKFYMLIEVLRTNTEGAIVDNIIHTAEAYVAAVAKEQRWRDMDLSRSTVVLSKLVTD